eukprot:scaffold35968_cov15-Tisochrysis_lutea.AAC.1
MAISTFPTVSTTCKSPHLTHLAAKALSSPVVRGIGPLMVRPPTAMDWYGCSRSTSAGEKRSAVELR